MARDPVRIDRIINLLRVYWHAHPDLRLGQIVVNLTPLQLRSESWTYEGHSVAPPVDPYYVEDYVFESALLAASRRAKAEREDGR